MSNKPLMTPFFFFDANGSEYMRSEQFEAAFKDCFHQAERDESSKGEFRSDIEMPKKVKMEAKVKRKQLMEEQTGESLTPANYLSYLGKNDAKAVAHMREYGWKIDNVDLCLKLF